MNPWQELGIAPTRELRDIRRAYAIRLKRTNPEDDPQGFQRLRSAYEAVIAMATQAQQLEAEEQEPDDDEKEDAADTQAVEPRDWPADEPRHERLPGPASLAPREPVPDTVSGPPLDVLPDSIPKPPPATPPDSVPRPSPEVLPDFPPRPPRDLLPDPLPGPPRDRLPDFTPPPRERLPEFGRPSPDPTPDLPPPPHPFEAALVLCADLLQQPPEKRRAVLAERMRKPGWEALDFRAALQNRIVEVLNEQFDLHSDLVGPFADYYEWNARSRGIGPRHPLIERLAERYNARTWVRSLGGDTGPGTEPRRKALALLRKPVDEKESKAFARWSTNMLAMEWLLETLSTSQQAARHYEMNAHTIDWWRQHADRFPTVWDRQLIFAFVGLLIGLGLAAHSLADVDHPFDPPWRPGNFVALLFLLAPWLSCVALEAAWRMAKRRERAGSLNSLEATFRRWHREPWSNRALSAVMGLLLAASLNIELSPWFWLAPAAGALLLATRDGFRHTFSVVTLYGWPLAISVFMVGLATSKAAPDLLAWPVPGMIGFSWLSGVLLFTPFGRLLSWVRGRFGFRPYRGAFAIFYWSFGLMATGVLVAGMVVGFVKERARIANEPDPPLAVSQSQVFPTGSAGETRRPFNEVRGPAVSQVRRLLTTYFPDRKPPPGASIRVKFTVQPNGLVTDASVDSSTFGDPRFDEALVHELATEKYRADPSYSPSYFVYVFGVPQR